MSNDAATDWLPKTARVVVGVGLAVIAIVSTTAVSLLAAATAVDARAAAQVAPVAKDLAEHKLAEQQAQSAQKATSDKAFEDLRNTMQAVVNDVATIKTDVAVLRQAASDGSRPRPAGYRP